MPTPTELAARVAEAAHHPRAWRTLLLDLDGTLAPLAPTPDEARVPPATLDLLARLARDGWTVAIVSGRPSRELRRLVPVRQARLFGSHGLEGSWHGPATRIDPALGRRLGRLAASGRRLAAGTPGALVERKPAGLAFHDRRIPAGRLAGWRRDLEAWIDRQHLDGLERIEGHRVVELRPRGAHKGRVVASLPRRSRAPRPDASLVAIGDDRTDEDLFRAMSGRGFSLRVGPPSVASCADGRLASPLAVQRFLRTLAARSG